MATWYVDATSAGGAGTSPATAKKSIAEALPLMSGGDTLNIADGMYREGMSLNGLGGPSATNRTRILFGPAAILSGGVQATGLVRCTAADAAEVGAIWPNVFKEDIPTASFPAGDPEAANVCENFVQLAPANSRADKSEEFFIDKPDYYWVADSVTLSGIYVTGYRKDSVTSLYTKAQLENATIQIIVEPNVGAKRALIFENNVMKVQGSPVEYENNTFTQKRFALLNLLPAMGPGEWGVKQNGATTTLYVYPKNAGNVAAGLISYSRLSNGIEAIGTNNLEISGGVVDQFASVGLTDAPIRLRRSGANSQAIHIHHMRVTNTLSVGNYGALYVDGVDDFHMHDFEILRCQKIKDGRGLGIALSGNNAGAADFPSIGCVNASSIADGVTVNGQTSGATVKCRFLHRKSGDLGAGTATARVMYEPKDLTGTFQTGETLRVGTTAFATCDLSKGDTSKRGDASLVQQMLRANIHDFKMDLIASAGIRGYTVKDLAVYHGTIKRAGYSSHANVVYWYQGSHNNLVWGINAEEAGGYYTSQEFDSCVFAFCAGSASTAPSGGARYMYMQNNRFSELPGEVYGYLGSFCLNTRGIPMPERVEDPRYGNGISVSAQYQPKDKWTVLGNITHGDADSGGAPLIRWDYNINTKGSGTGTGTRGPDDIVADWSTMYVDAVADDFRYKADAAVRTFTVENWSSLIAGFAARWPQVDPARFQEDMARQPIAWNNLRAGPVGDMDYNYRTDEAGNPTLPPTPSPIPELEGTTLRPTLTVT